MIRAVLDGLSHPHVAYFLDEARLRPDELTIVGVRPDPGDDPALLPAGIPRFDDTVALLDSTRPDVLFACGPYAGRTDVALRALERDVHVLADKPLAADAAGLDLLRAAAARTDAHLSIAFEKRWYASTLRLRALVAAGALGEVRLVSATGPHRLRPAGRPAWYFDGRYGDPVVDLPIHDVDLVLELTGGRTGWVSAWRSPHAVAGTAGFADACALTVGVDDRVHAAVDAHWVWPEASDVHGRYEMRVTGTRGTAWVDWAADTVEVVSDVDTGPLDVPAALRPVEEFVDALLAGRAPEVGTAQSLAATQVVVLAARSASQGGARLTWSH